MLSSEQIKKRINYIGGSDAACLLGLSRWKTPLALWAEKTKQILPEDISGKMQVRLGNKMEDTIAELFTEETGLKVRRVNETIYHREYPFLAANIDRKIVGEDYILECKHTSERRANEWNEGVPIEYLIQCYHYLAVTDCKKAYLACLIGNQELKIKEIDRDEKILSDLIVKEVYFWREFIEKKIMPGVVDNDDSVLYRLFPHAEQGQIIQLGDDVNAKCEMIESLNQDKFTVEKQIDKLKNELKALIKENETGDTGRYQIRWSNVKKEAYTVAASEYRQFRIACVNRK